MLNIQYMTPSPSDDEGGYEDTLGLRERGIREMKQEAPDSGLHSNIKN